MLAAKAAANAKNSEMKQMQTEHERETSVLAGELAQEREKNKELSRKTTQLQTGVKERDSVNPKP